MTSNELRWFRLAALVVLGACSSASSADPLADAGTSPPVTPPPDDAGITDAKTPPSDGPTDGGPTTRVRIMAANTTSGGSPVYGDPGIRIFQGLTPDIVLIQEFNYPSDDRRALVDTAFGTGFQFYVEPRVGGIPNGIVSRYPILESGVWADSPPDRAFAYARIDVPGPIDLWAVSVHLLTTGATQRNTEAVALLGFIQATVPAGSYLALGGDFNTEATDEAALVTLSAVLTVAPPYPSDQAGNPNTSINRNHPHDFLFASPNLAATKTAVTIGSGSFVDGLVFDSRVFTPLGDVAPVLITDSEATGMQHMPVVRDFFLPLD